LSNLLEIRHGCGVVGKSAGKFALVEAVAKATNTKIVGRLHPLEYSSDDFWGVGGNIKDWKDGVFTKLFREVNNESCGDDRKIIVLEGNINPVWIELFNALLDNNKVLTLPGGGFINLHSSVKLVFLTDSMINATPATVSRLGMVYLQHEEEFASLKSFNDSVVSNLKALGSADYMAHKKVMMALAMINAMHFGQARDEGLDFQQTANFAKNYLNFSTDMAGFKFMVQDFVVLSVPANL